MKPHRLSILFCVILFLSYLSASGAPAFRGKIMLIQPDGTEFPAILRGDEFFNVLTTTEGHFIIQDSEGYYCYATFGPDGTRQSSGYRVGGDVPASVLASSMNIPYERLATKAPGMRSLPETVHEEPILSRLNKARGITKAGEGSPVTKHGIVILAGFKDVKFRYGKADFESLLTQQGYNVNGATGSAKDYFDAQFKGQFEFEFDVFGPVELSHDMAYYGANKSDGNDIRPHEMVKEACRLADALGADFTEYDDDKDGVVDNVYVFYAGGDAAQGAGDKHIWAHAWYLSAANVPKGQRIFDGVEADRYACSAEISLLEGMKSPVITGIGTFCHEYSHTLGLMDMYDTDKEGSGGTANGLWEFTSLMDAGNYNNDGKTPPYFNAIEREMTGILEPVELAVNGEPYTMAPICNGGEVYRISGEVEDEYYLVECRDYSDEFPWDKYIEGRGMLIYHVDKSVNDAGHSDYYKRSLSAKERWKFNEVNANPEYECASLAFGERGVFFPQDRADSFEPVFRNGQKSRITLSGIVRNADGSVTFSALTSIGAEKIRVEAFQDFAIIGWAAESGYNGKSYITIPAVSAKVFEVEQKGGSYSFVTRGQTFGEDNRPIILKPATEYTAEVHFKDNDGNDTAKETATFKTARYREGSYPYIFLKNVERNSDGTFKAGTELPLAIYNAIGQDVTWYMNDVEIKRGDNGYYKLPGSGTLKAVINLDEGHTHTIVKEIIVR